MQCVINPLCLLSLIKQGITFQCPNVCYLFTIVGPAYRCDNHTDFACKTNYRCVPLWSVCNGHDDCRDNSDEQGCGESVTEEDELRTCLNHGNDLKIVYYYHSIRTLKSQLPLKHYRVRWREILMESVSALPLPHSLPLSESTTDLLAVWYGYI